MIQPIEEAYRQCQASARDDLDMIESIARSYREDEINSPEDDKRYTHIQSYAETPTLCYTILLSGGGTTTGIRLYISEEGEVDFAVYYYQAAGPEATIPLDTEEIEAICTVYGIDPESEAQFFFGGRK